MNCIIMSCNKPQSICNDSEIEYIRALRKGAMFIACRVCGQCHSANRTHLYDYEGTVDDDLICHLCFQPFVNPVDTKCGCTFCAVCLQNYLKSFKYCPLDNTKIDLKNCHKASPALRRILDKLLVVCPNIDYCEEVLPRHQLEFHLLTQCKGTVTYCPQAHFGCEFQGPRSALSSHLQECSFNEINSGDMLKEPIIPGKLCQIEIHRGYSDLGLYVVGGCDTPLITTVIQRIKSNSVVDKDGRLEPGDHIIRLNGHDLTMCTHQEVLDLFSLTIPICSMTVYRESIDESYNCFYEFREELIKITILKQKGQQLGIKLGHRKKEKGVWILNIIKDSIAEADGRLRINDRILEINSQNVKYASKDEAIKLIQASPALVCLLVVRELEPINLPITEVEQNVKNQKLHTTDSSIWQEFTLGLYKEKGETLGLNIKGGIGSYDGENTPVFVASIEPKSCIEKSKHIRKGDLIVKIDEESLIGCSLTNALDVVDNSSENEILSITYVRCPDYYEESAFFKPTWRYFISIPIAYQIAKSVQVYKDSNDYLGLTISGGKDTAFDKIFIKSVIPNSSAARSKKLRSGDMILSVDGISLQNVLHTDAIQFLKSLSGMIRFVVVSCPGSLI